MKGIYFKNTPVNIPFLRYTVQKFAETDKTLSRMLDIIQMQEQRINKLVDVIHELAPEYDAIETLAENDEERAEMVERYMNHNEEYYY